MKITQKAVSSFNAGKEPTFNANHNKAQGIHSLVEHAIFRRVQDVHSGILKQPISLKKVKEWLERQPESYLVDLEQRFKKYG